mgnify:FL=1|tara:strand:+ start:1978 stop:2436 length:459 start_codon:yes stop_codon:yes gene_type:complete
MSTNLEKALIQLGCIKTTDTNVGIGSTTFFVINSNNLCSYTNTGVTTTASYNSTEAANDYLNSVEWRKPDGTISMSPSDFVVDYDKVGPVVELLMLREQRNKKLADSDWTQYNDSPLSGSKKTEWATYRQSLRDITSSSQSIFSVTWPTEPS